MGTGADGSGDVVIVVPGIMGSELDRAIGPVWSMSRGLGTLGNLITSFGRSIKQLELPPGIGAEHPNDDVVATGLMPSMHVIPGMWAPIVGYSELLTFLASERFNLRPLPEPLLHIDHPKQGELEGPPSLVTFPYDWRLSNEFNGRELAKFADRILTKWREGPGDSSSKLIFVCHSMGGLVARRATLVSGIADETRALISIGTPHRGAARAVATLVNGLAPSLGPLRINLSDFARSCPSLHELLPTYDCLGVGERTSLSDAGGPGLDSTMLANAVAFHQRLNKKPPAVALHKAVGIRQPTVTTVKVVDGVAHEMTTIDGLEQGGDGTVPRLAAEPEHDRGLNVADIADHHGRLQGCRALLDLVDGIITRNEVIWQSGDKDALGLDYPDVVPSGSSSIATVVNPPNVRLRASVLDETGTLEVARTQVAADGNANIEALAEGCYQLSVGPAKPGSKVASSTKPFVVLDPVEG